MQRLALIKKTSIFVSGAAITQPQKIIFSPMRINTMIIKKMLMPPSVNKSKTIHRYTKRIIKSEEYRIYEDKITKWKLNNFHALRAIEIEVREELSKHKFFYVQRFFCFCKKNVFYKNGNQRKNDISNRIKILDDTLSKILGIDDTRFVLGSEELILVENESLEQVIVRITPHEQIRTLHDLYTEYNLK